jgi:hypothetical protein
LLDCQPPSRRPRLDENRGSPQPQLLEFGAQAPPLHLWLMTMSAMALRPASCSALMASRSSPSLPYALSSWYRSLRCVRVCVIVCGIVCVCMIVCVCGRGMA